MPPRLTKPQDLPEARQAMVDILWRFYVWADRPSAQKIAKAIQDLPEQERNGTANHETVRLTLRGDALGAWQTVEVIFLGLCELADIDPEDEEGGDNRWDPPTSYREQLRRAWHRAVDGDYMPDKPRTRTERAREAAQRAKERVTQTDDPWGTAPPTGGFNDKPPF
ncbi:hypothetical protein [Actinokineospora sp. HUAS TT18]|uniref:hypothetical protein n=1 Tax=Actinokineospora sp. HUAS TT18 TaxID=3447451 RepID=UPI003F52798E